MHFITCVKKIIVQYHIEVLLGASIIVSCGVLWAVMTMGNTNKEYEGVDLQEGNVNKIVEEDKKIYVEISGAVYKPGVYSFSQGARLHTALENAGGLNKHADKNFFYRNYNQARILIDGEKIHAPSLTEVENGSFIEQPLLIFTNEIKTAGSNNTSPATININAASQSELESLSGVGKATAEKIIQNRPYASLDDLINKTVISQTLFNKIKSSLSL